MTPPTRIGTKMQLKFNPSRVEPCLKRPPMLNASVTNKRSALRASLRLSPCPKLATLFIYMLIGRRRWASGRSHPIPPKKEKKIKPNIRQRASVCQCCDNEATGAGSKPRIISVVVPPPTHTHTFSPPPPPSRPPPERL